MEKLVSVVIPSYGGADYLERCIDSVLNQTYKFLEVIVVDDNGKGTPNQISTAIVMQKYDGDERVKYLCHEVNINGSAARNTGARYANGEYIALMDDDDIFYPEKIKRQVAMLESLTEEYGATYCSCDIYHNGEKVGGTSVSISGGILYECLANKVQMASTSMLIRKTAYWAINGFDESFKRHQDWEFRARLAAKFKIQADDFIGFRRILVFRNSLNTPELYKERREFYLNKMEPFISLLPLKQQKDVRVYHRMEIALMFFKQKHYKQFWKEIIASREIARCMAFMLKRMLLITKRGKLRLVN